MERAKYILAAIMLLIAETVSSTNAWKMIIYESYIGNDMDRWQETIDIMEKEKINSFDFLSQLVNYQYGYIGWCIGNNRSSCARKYLNQAEDNLKLLSQYASSSLINAYQSAFYGYKIGLNRLRAPVYGPRSVRHAQLAIEEDPANPLGYIQYGNSQYYMPAIFGGSKTEAIQYFQKALKLMEKDESKIKNDWNYLSLLTLIAQSLEATGETSRAIDYYKKILQIEPKFLWVKDELYPQLIKNK